MTFRPCVARVQKTKFKREETMKKLLAVLAAAAALSFGLPGAANAGFYCTDDTLLIRSINTDREETIGDVNVACSGYTLTVSFNTSSAAKFLRHNT